MTVPAKLGTFSAMSLIVNKMIGTGIFSNPAIIYRYVEGSISLFLGLYGVGGIIIGCGLIIYLEFAMNLPFTNGGEKNYLLRVARHWPKGLAGCVYAFSMVLLGFSSGNAYTFGKYVLYAAYSDGSEISDGWAKVISVICISGCCYLHWRHPNSGTTLYNALGLIKVVVLLVIIIIGLLVFVGLVNPLDTDPGEEVILNGSPGAYNVSVALLQVIYSFKGWENANYVLSQVENPITVLTVAAPLAVISTTVLYYLVVLSYLVVIPKNEFLNSGVLCAGVFFTKIFGRSVASRMLPIMIAISNLGNVMVVSYAHSVVNQELARNNYLPWSRVWQKWPAALFLHWFFSVVVVVTPPSSEIYEFIVNLYIYPGTWINVVIAGGLLYLRWTPSENWNNGYHEVVTEGVDGLDIPEDDEIIAFNPDVTCEQYIHRYGSQEVTPTSSHVSLHRTMSVESIIIRKTIKSPYFAIFLFLAANIFLAIFPFVPPPETETAIPYWLFPVIGTGVLALGGVFWWARPGKALYEEEYQRTL